MFGHKRNFVLKVDSTSIGNDLDTRPSRRKEIPMVVGVDESSRKNCLDLVKIVKSMRRKWKTSYLHFKHQEHQYAKKFLHMCPNIIVMREVCSHVYLLTERVGL